MLYRAERDQHPINVIILRTYEGFLSHGATSKSSIFKRFFHEINHPAMGVPPWIGTPPAILFLRSGRSTTGAACSWSSEPRGPSVGTQVFDHLSHLVGGFCPSWFRGIGRIDPLTWDITHLRSGSHQVSKTTILLGEKDDRWWSPAGGPTHFQATPHRFFLDSWTNNRGKKLCSSAFKFCDSCASQHSTRIQSFLYVRNWPNMTRKITSKNPRSSMCENLSTYPLKRSTCSSTCLYPNPPKTFQSNSFPPMIRRL